MCQERLIVTTVSVKPVWGDSSGSFQQMTEDKISRVICRTSSKGQTVNSDRSTREEKAGGGWEM